jgi:tRNA-2-methylthio-N6-dimethylallyladenosine synthase
MKSYFFETYGCQMNKAESSALEALFAERGWKAAASEDGADLILINTCSVRITAENRVWGRLGYYAAKKRERDFTLIVAGCMAERLKPSLRDRAPAVDYVVGTFQKAAFGLLIDAIGQGKKLEVLEESPAFVFAHSYYEPGAFRSFVPIMHGCDNFCAYCIVPYIRGREVSRNPRDVLSEIEALEDSGVREITLLGQNVNSYRFKDSQGSELDFRGLLEAISRRLSERGKGGIRWLRFLTSHPKDLSQSVIETLARDTLFCRHIHLCVQHGSNPVLRAMNRKYTRESYLDLVGRIRSAMPDVSLSTDLLVGFPGETEEDLELTLDLMREVRFEYAFTYKFNPREGTKAAALGGQLPDETKRERLSRVIELQREITKGRMGSRIGSRCTVLVEDMSKRGKDELLARTQRDEMVVFRGERSAIGSFASVSLDALRGNTFRASLDEGRLDA